MWMLAARYDFDFRVEHKPGARIEIADALSRVHMQPKFQALVKRLLDRRVQLCKVNDALFRLNNAKENKTEFSSVMECLVDVSNILLVACKCKKLAFKPESRLHNFLPI